MNTAPTFYSDLAALRASGRRPLGGVVVTDCWEVAQQSARLQLLPLYLRKREKWSEYAFAALRDLDVLIHLRDSTRATELVALISRASPRSLRLYTPEQHEMIFGGEHAAAEVMRWLIARAQIAAKRRVAA